MTNLTSTAFAMTVYKYTCFSQPNLYYSTTCQQTLKYNIRTYVVKYLYFNYSNRRHRISNIYCRYKYSQANNIYWLRLLLSESFLYN